MVIDETNGKIVQEIFELYGKAGYRFCLEIMLSNQIFKTDSFVLII